MDLEPLRLGDSLVEYEAALNNAVADHTARTFPLLETIVIICSKSLDLSLICTDVGTLGVTKASTCAKLPEVI
jgi:hypothetical protein